MKEKQFREAGVTERSTRIAVITKIVSILSESSEKYRVSSKKEKVTLIFLTLLLLFFSVDD
jgi:hypothetical protein